MTDQELIELAAEAIKLPECGWMHKTFTYVKNNTFTTWDPLNDDGDALRLLTKLPFREIYVSEIGVTVSWPKDGGPHRWKCDEYASEHGGSLSAAARRAIVRAAAQMEKGPQPVKAGG